jgi:hypothetical protein
MSSEEMLIKALLGGLSPEDVEGNFNMFSVGGSEGRRYLMVDAEVYDKVDLDVATKFEITVIKHCGVPEMEVAMALRDVHDLIDPVQVNLSPHGVMLAGPVEEAQKVVSKLVDNGFGWIPTTVLPPGNDVSTKPLHGPAESLVVTKDIMEEIESLCNDHKPMSPVKSHPLTKEIRALLDRMESDRGLYGVDSDDLTRVISGMVMLVIKQRLGGDFHA